MVWRKEKLIDLVGVYLDPPSRARAGRSCMLQYPRLLPRTGSQSTGPVARVKLNAIKLRHIARPNYAK